MADAAAAYVEPNTKVLADLIERDPAFRVLLANDSTLEFDMDRTTSVPPQHYRRLVFLAQLALCIVLADTCIDVEPNGIYDEATMDAVAEFHRRIGVSPEEGGHGALMGPHTLSALVMRVRHDAYSIKMEFAKAQMQFAKIAPFYIHPGAQADERDNAGRGVVRQAIASAMVWMGYMDIDVDVATAGGRHLLKQAIDEHICEDGERIDIVGPRTMNRILARLDEVHRGI
jgi:hypothetical protein